ncbi:DEAD/DEAH box helicase [Alkalihalobacillus sp. 1P02AB]|uniref:DEAD/DEAH box helicase n=1 Tax=Alkalihalobacillus sp. 1P02AB TaxID=3132260 RepID=UPI0039A54823
MKVLPPSDSPKKDKVQSLYVDNVNEHEHPPNSDTVLPSISTLDTEPILTSLSTSKSDPYLYGKLLLKRELPLSEKNLHLLIEQKNIEAIPAMIKKGGTVVCVRCNNQKKSEFGQHPCALCGQLCLYCRHCLSLGKVQSCQKLYRWIGAIPQQQQKPGTLKWEGRLSLGQERASEAICEWIRHQKRGLTWAVCGAGKTEIVFKGLELVFEKGGRALLATPRTDVVKELVPRFKSAFPSLKIAALYGGSEDQDEYAEFVIATTHQILRYERSFDFIIVDEVDAFPYSYDKSLQFAVRRARKENSPLVYLSATPSRELLRQKSLEITKIPKRFHGYPLPVPTMVWGGDWQKKMKKGKLPTPLKKWLKGHQHQPILLFVPTIFALEKVSAILTKQGLVHGAVHASAKTRHQAVKAFRLGEIPLLVTTTILERGVTISNVAVAVLGAEKGVFDEAALVQIAGRVGRNPNFPSGDVCFFHYGKSLAMKRAIQQIKSMNQEGGAL